MNTNIKKITSIILALIIGCTCAMCAFAAETTNTVVFLKNCEDTTASVPENITVKSGESFTIPSTQFRQGYGLKAWNTKADGTGDEYAIGAKVTPTAEMSLYAIWGAVASSEVKDSECSVAWAKDYSTCTKSWASSTTYPNQVIYKETVKTTSTATATGTTYTAKFTVAGFESETKVVSSTTFTVTYYTNCTDTAIKAPDAAKVTADTELTLAAAPARTGYTFKEWNTKADGTGTTYTPGKTAKFADNTSLYAIWVSNAKSYTLTIIANTTDEGKKTTTTVKAGEAISYKAETVENLEYVGLYEDAEYKTANTNKTMPEKDLTLYALYATKLSCFEQSVKAIDIDSVKKEFGVSDEALDAFCKSAGYTITYTIDGKEYTANSLVNAMTEILASCKKDIAYGKTAKLVISLIAGKNANPETYSYYILNDIKTADTSNTDTSNTNTSNANVDTSNTDTSKADTSDTASQTGDTDLYIEDSTAASENTTVTKTAASVDTDVPDTGSTNTVAIVAALCIALAAGCAAVVVTKRKKVTE